MKLRLIAAILIWAVSAQAQDVVVIGEVHDNPAHHQLQAQKVAEIKPMALVFEMLTITQAAKITDDVRTSPERLEAIWSWAGNGWPNFEMYAPIFEAAPDARVYGALVPGPNARSLMSESLARKFDELKDTYGLDQPLPADQQEAREALQMAAHCDALPPKALPGMVEFQRLRDASLADAANIALLETGGPVVVITGNGHARRDWGMPALLAQISPEAEIQVIGQSEDDQPLSGEFDTVLSAPAVDRPDPCLAFQ